MTQHVLDGACGGRGPGRRNPCRVRFCAALPAPPTVQLGASTEYFETTSSPVMNSPRLGPARRGSKSMPGQLGEQGVNLQCMLFGLGPASPGELPPSGVVVACPSRPSPHQLPAAAAGLQRRLLQMIQMQTRVSLQLLHHLLAPHCSWPTCAGFLLLMGHHARPPEARCCNCNMLLAEPKLMQSR